MSEVGWKGDYIHPRIIYIGIRHHRLYVFFGAPTGQGEAVFGPIQTRFFSCVLLKNQYVMNVLINKIATNPMADLSLPLSPPRTWGLAVFTFFIVL